MNQYQRRLIYIGLFLLASVGIWGETIRLQPDPGFARGVDWVSFPQKGMNSMVVAADGSIVMSNVLQHCLYKFSPDGKFRKKIGRKGEGPGDFNTPKVSSILDDRLLVIGEYALTRRISLFDMEGRFVKVLRTKENCNQALALKNNRVAYLGISFDERNKNPGGGISRRDTISIIDVTTGKETTVVSFPRIARSSIPISQGYTISVGSVSGETLLVAMPTGDLIVGSSDESKLNVYSPEGNLLRTFDLGIPAREVSSNFVSRFREEVLRRYRQPQSSSKNKNPSPFLQALERYDFRKLFGDRLPVYSFLQVTKDGRLLVLPYSDQAGETKGPFRFKVYDLTGRPAEDLVIETGSFQLEIDSRFRSLEVTLNALYALVTSETEDGDERRIIRVSLGKK